GIHMYLNPDDYVQCMMFYNRYGRETLEVFRSFVRPGDIVIDIGAHVGFFTLFLAELVTCQGRVYSFEPDVRARKSLERSVAASKMEWVTVSPFALASKSGTTRFYLARGLGSSSAVKGEQQIDATETVVSTISLDELIQRGDITGSVRLLKIDIEGFELDAIRGMSELLKRDRPVMLIEVNEEMLNARGVTPECLFNVLSSLDYDFAAVTKSPRGRYRRRVPTIDP